MAISLGIHATLTGVRGFIGASSAPLLNLGVILRPSGPDVSLPGLRGWCFVLFAGVRPGAALMFPRMQRDAARNNTATLGAWRRVLPRGMSVPEG